MFDRVLNMLLYFTKNLTFFSLEYDDALETPVSNEETGHDEDVCRSTISLESDCPTSGLNSCIVDSGGHIHDRFYYQQCLMVLRKIFPRIDIFFLYEHLLCRNGDLYSCVDDILFNKRGQKCYHTKSAQCNMRY